MSKSKVYCCVQGCNSCAKRDKVSFHIFPPWGRSKIKITKKNGTVEKVDVRTMWERNLRCTKKITKSMRVCSNHFEKSAFYPRAIYAAHIIKRRKLKWNAVPTKNLPEGSCVRIKKRQKRNKHDTTQPIEVIKCGLCKEEIEYAQRCRVYVKTNESRPFQRVSKRPHIGRFKIISTARSTEHISFARRLKRLRETKNLKISFDSLHVDDTCLEKQSSDEKIEDSSTENNNNPIGTSLCDLDVSGIQEKNKGHIESDSLKTSEQLKSTREEPIRSEAPQKNIIGSSELKSEYQVATPEKKQAEEIMNYPHFQSSFEEYIKPILSKKTLININNDSDKNKMIHATSTPKSVKNGGPIMSSQGTGCETYYWLEIPKSKQPESRKLGYQFDNLVAEVKHMKLPNPDWKIKIMVHKQEMVSVSFTKRVAPEKIVTVNAKSLVCEITLDGKKIILLGSPVYIHSIKDLEIMLDIVNDVQPDSPIIGFMKPS